MNLIKESLEYRARCRVITLKVIPTSSQNCIAGQVFCCCEFFSEYNLIKHVVENMLKKDFQQKNSLYEVTKLKTFLGAEPIK
jgi:hypothetical protein